MEANTPEKLYFGESDRGLLDIYSTKESDDDIEYTRTDAFIEKSAIEKFQELPHINSNYEIQEDWAYAPNLYHFDGEWHVSWIHCSEGDELDGFSGSTPEEAINMAYNWFHSNFCND